MFAGHVGVGLAVARAERRVPAWVFVFAAMFADFVLWLLVLAGRESVAVPADFAATRQLQFDFPWSHGLAASVAWSLLAGAAAGLALGGTRRFRLRAAALVALAVLSHWLLDALVHAPELPLAGAGSRRVGLGLWHQMPAALALEALLAFGGLALFLRGGGAPRGRRTALAAFVFLLVAFTVLGMTVAPAPPSATAMAASSLAMIGVTGAVVGWLGRPRAAASGG